VPGPEGFDYEVRTGEVVISHHGRRATVLRGSAANRFLAEVEDADEAVGQELMARVTGNYRRGNERTAKNHPRNAGR
jgi:hypothetical protein